MSPGGYLGAKRAAEIRHELVNGVVYAMSGISRWHSLIVANLLIAIGTRIRGRDCDVSGPKLRVRIPASEAYVYSDVVVYCDGGRWLDGQFDTLEDPLVVVEVLSPSTERYDRGAKFEHYKLIDSLSTYVLVAQDGVLVESYARMGDEWVASTAADLGDHLNLPALGLAIPLGEIYHRVEVSADPRIPHVRK